MENLSNSNINSKNLTIPAYSQESWRKKNINIHAFVLTANTMIHKKVSYLFPSNKKNLYFILGKIVQIKLIASE